MVVSHNKTNCENFLFSIRTRFRVKSKIITYEYSKYEN